MCVRVLVLVRSWECVCVCVQIWQDDLIHQGLPLLVWGEGGDKNNLAKRDVHIHTHSCTQPASDSKAMAIGLEQLNHVTPHARTDTHAGSDSLEPGYSPVRQDELCKPATGMWGA